MINNIKLIRARLVRNGIKGISNAIIKEAILKHTDDSDDFTDEQKDAVVAELLQVYQSENTNTDNAELTEISEDKESSEEVNQEMLASLPKVETAITPAQKTEMIANQAQLMGLVLAENDIQNIAQQVDFQSSDSSDLIDEIKNSLIAFISYRESQSQAKVSQAFTEIIHHANASNQRVSDSLHTGLQSVAAQMEEQRNHFKSSVRSSLRYFAIPGSETYE